jgi:hypothetical protein
MIFFSQPKTALGAIKLTGWLSLDLVANQTLALSGEGLILLGGGTAFGGKVAGNVLLRFVDDSRSGYLSSTWNAPMGTIEGSVANVSGQVCPGRPNISGSGIMTIDGHRGRGAAGLVKHRLRRDGAGLPQNSRRQTFSTTRPQLQGA